VSQDQVKDLEKKVEQSAAKSGWLHARRAEMYMQMGKYDEAIADCAEALKLAGDHLHHTYFTRGCAYEHKREYEKALADLSEAIRIGPDYTEPYKHRGIIHVNLREWNKAAADYSKLLDLEPTNPELWFETAYLRLQVGDENGYRELCRRMLERFGQSANENDIVQLAHTCVLAPRSLGDGMQVLEIAKKRSALPPFGGQIWSVHVLGHAYYRTGLYDKAVECLESGLKDHADWQHNVFNWLVLAMSHQRLNHGTEARKWLVKAQEWIGQETFSLPGKGSSFAPKGWHWRDLLGVQLLRREAEALMSEIESSNGTESKPPKEMKGGPGQPPPKPLSREMAQDKDKKDAPEQKDIVINSGEIVGKVTSIDANEKSFHLQVGKQDVKVMTIDDVKIRTKNPPVAYDDKGKIRKYTAKELKVLKGDSKLPGYLAEFYDLRANQIVQVSLVHKKSNKTTQPLASVILIISEPN
jgi:tetratricopeptide (TPR) repeat protein